MERWVNYTCEFLQKNWQQATLMNYGYVVLGIIIFSWALAKYTSRPYART